MSSVANTIRTRALIGAGDRILVALSGGGDSVAMLWILRDLATDDADWSVAGLVHVNHNLRGEESDADEAFCRTLATEVGLPIIVHQVDVVARAKERKLSLEVAARQLRYERFDIAAAELKATRVATGHTADDQAETVLLRLLRGAGARGLSAIRPRRGHFVRPLIDTARADLGRYLTSHGRTFREDSSNRDHTIPRNRVRHTLMPLLATEWPSAVRALARFAELAADDEAFLSRTAEEVRPALTLQEPHGVQLDTRGLADLPAALSRRILRQAIETCGGVPSFRDIEATRRLAKGKRAKGRLDLRRVTVSRRGVVLALQPAASVEAVTAFDYELEVPGSVHVAETGKTLWASVSRERRTLDLGRSNAAVAALQADTIVHPLRVRNRRPGDRFRPLGSPGSRKLQDVLVDRKVQRNTRDRVLVVVDGLDRIVWVAGLEIAHDCRVTAPERGMVILETKDTE